MSTRKDRSENETGNEAGEEIPITVETPADAVEAAAEPAPDEISEMEIETEASEDAAEAVEGEPADPLAAAKQEAADYYDRLLRLSAEFDNYKKRSNRELAEFRKFSNEQIIKDLLGVIDNLERALSSAVDQEGCSKPIAEGVELTLKEILKILENYGVTVIAAQGETFDPTYHQAVMQQETADQPPNTVIQELQKGYLLHNRLLRPSMVTVSKASGESE
ncbi:MAG: nucleotide exchange factor GrpE [Desulfosarcinaceae bacterium]|nr:nucleotide exchange factor GrpE [Desulfosarcinaceae bacterium]